MKIKVYGEYVDLEDDVIRVDAITALSRISDTAIKMLWANSDTLSERHFDNKESADKVWNVITGVMRKYSK